MLCLAHRPAPLCMSVPAVSTSSWAPTTPLHGTCGTAQHTQHTQHATGHSTVQHGTAQHSTRYGQHGRDRAVALAPCGTRACTCRAQACPHHTISHTSHHTTRRHTTRPRSAHRSPSGMLPRSGAGWPPSADSATSAASRAACLRKKASRLGDMTSSWPCETAGEERGRTHGKGRRGG